MCNPTIEGMVSRVIISHQADTALPNGAYRQWELTHRYFSDRKQLRCDLDANIENACYCLTAFLACWGMYRASAAIKETDALIHAEIIRELLLKKYDPLHRLGIGDANGKNIDMVNGLVQTVETRYREAFEKQKDPDGKQVIEQKNLGTLATKTILVVLGCMPAEDRFYTAGLRHVLGRRARKEGGNFERLVVWANNNYERLQELRTEIGEINNQRPDCRVVDYPDFKILDMIFFQTGRSLN